MVYRLKRAYFLHS